MSVFGPLQRSMSRTLVGLPLFLSSMVPGPPQMAHHSHQNFRPQDFLRPIAPSSYEMDRFFIDALVQACFCREHSHHISARPSISTPPYIYHKARRRNALHNVVHARFFHSSRINASSPQMRPSITADEYKKLLDYYLDPFGENPGLEISGAQASALPPLDTHDYHDPIVLGELNKPEESSIPERSSPLVLEPGDSHEKLAIERLIRLLENEDISQGVVLEAYSVLPFPGVSYLPESVLRLLFRRISVVERKTNETMLGYLSVVDDMKAANLSLTEAEWNSAIAFTGRCFAKVTATEVELALLRWKEMEDEAKVKSGNVTFNILFDIATKSGKFVLAEMVLKEMQARGLSINRFMRSGLIYYHGLRGDGDGVRKAYLSLVEAGELVDTVILNCVIASLIRAGESSAAHQVYERMKALFSSQTGSPVPCQSWRAVRDLGRVLDRAARQHRKYPERRQRLQDELCLAPNLQTYAILVEHHATDTGELRRITALLEEMQSLGIPMHGRIFVKLFKGFATHGGVRYTSWTRQRLESVWASLLINLDERVPYVTVEKWMVVWATRAFSKCCGRQRALEIWAELGTRWKAEGPEEERAVFSILRDNLRPGPGLE